MKRKEGGYRTKILVQIKPCQVSKNDSNLHFSKLAKIKTDCQEFETIVPKH